MAMLNKDLIKLVLIAFIIATPVGWYSMYKWLQDFAYRTEISWWIFLLAGLIAFVIALATVSLQSWRSAARNPSKHYDMSNKTLAEIIRIRYFTEINICYKLKHNLNL